MDWEYAPGSVANIDDVQADDALHANTSPFVAYLWGFLIVLAVILALREWSRHRLHKANQASRDRMWNYVVMAMLWPLFISAIVFVVLWVVLTRRDSR